MKTIKVTDELKMENMDGSILKARIITSSEASVPDKMIFCIQNRKEDPEQFIYEARMLNVVKHVGELVALINEYIKGV